MVITIGNESKLQNVIIEFNKSEKLSSFAPEQTSNIPGGTEGVRSPAGLGLKPKPIPSLKSEFQ